MLLARLRGLLQPDYRYGAISQGAEKMILRGLLAELSAEALDRRSAMEAMVLPVLDPKSRREVLVSAQDGQKRADKLRRLLFHETQSDQQKRTVDSLADLFYALERAGIIRDQPEDQ